MRGWWWDTVHRLQNACCAVRQQTPQSHAWPAPPACGSRHWPTAVGPPPAGLGLNNSMTKISATDFFDIVATHNDHRSRVKCVVDPLCVLPPPPPPPGGAAGPPNAPLQGNRAPGPQRTGGPAQKRPRPSQRLPPPHGLVWGGGRPNSLIGPPPPPFDLRTKGLHALTVSVPSLCVIPLVWPPGAGGVGSPGAGAHVAGLCAPAH